MQACGQQFYSRIMCLSSGASISVNTPYLSIVSRP